MKPFGFHRAAREEVTAAASRYAAISLSLADRFHDEIELLTQSLHPL